MINHAVITDLTGNIEDKIYEVTKFYLYMGLTPVIYTPFRINAYEKMLQPLKTFGYTVARYPAGGFYYYPGRKNVDKYPIAKNIVRIRNADQEIFNLFEGDEGSEYNVETIKKLLPHKEFYLWVLYEGSKPAATASVNLIDRYGCSAVDHVYTSPEFRNKGYATTIVKHAVNMHNKESNNLIFLYAYKEQPIRIYKNIGFVKMTDRRLDFWNAWRMS